MNKRKAPILLFGILVIAVGTMAVFNAMQNKESPEEQHQHQEEAVSEHTPTADERASASNTALQALSKTKPGEKSEGRNPVSADQGESEIAKTPTILIFQYTAARPLPNDAGTSTHWYDEQSRSYGISKANSKSRG